MKKSEGHSENEADSIHSRIESRSRHMNVYTTSQWASIIQTAKVAEPHYQITEMVTRDFIDFKGITSELVNMDKDTDKVNVN